MRICLVAHGFPPHELAGVENFTAGLARGLAAGGHTVEVFVPRRRPDLADLSLRREQRDGYSVQWLTVNQGATSPKEVLEPREHAAQFGRYLDRFRPDVVHFQHVFRVGAALLESAKLRGLPVVYTGHDYFPVCHRITLLRPDLERCETIGDPDVCARCDLGLSLLNQREELGDYHMGAFAEDLPDEVRERLAATLVGDEPASGFPSEEWTAARERRRGLDARRAELYGQVDRFLCPTRFLAERLVEGGIDPDRIVHLPYGIDTSALTGLDRPTVAELARRPLRFGFIGSLTKHKGVHVLLEAFERVRGRAELVIHGDSTDRVYVQRMAERAASLGVRLAGAFDQRELPTLLAAIDVLVVPSIWVENYPIAIREAFAAGRTVIASDVGAFPESVRHGVDGLTFAVGDAVALGDCLEACVDDPEFLVRLVRGIEPVHTLEAHVAEHERIYDELVTERIAARSHAVDQVLPHLRGIAARYEELESLASEDLLRRALDEVGRLAQQLGAPAASAGEWMARALARDVRTQDLLRDRETEGNYLRAELERRDEVSAELEARDAWRAEQLRGATEKLAWLEQQLVGLREENAWRKETTESLEGTVESLQRSVSSLEAERDWRVGTEAAAQEQAQRASRRLIELEVELDGLTAEVRALRDVVAQREEQLGELRLVHGRSEQERAWRQSEMDAAVALVHGRLRGLIPASLALRDELRRWRGESGSVVGDEPSEAGA
ncbi:glycosyltransferase family 4 protein [Engelhardtia mirabilis]|uniref:Glycogen synthase n=1 Tax=Engelhardtia mirabilis TaxID=2528011 RepID=A0A518BIP9_9BACT|nr:Glycogen synthase [Planctomycetes bacterium Pla133]QDV01177.1 Glycogen synthase [Planctomycetes bacterium Pla86]